MLLSSSQRISRYYRIAGRLLSSNRQNRVETRVTQEGVAHVVLNREEKLNGLDLPMFEDLAETAESLKLDKSIRAIILSGKGRAFCTGLDVKDVATKPKTVMERLLHRPSGRRSNLAQDVGYLWREVPAPVIAVLHGMCFGGGLQIALGADFRFATPDCKLSIMESKWGLVPDMSGSVTLRELLRADVAKELTMTGRILTGEEAAQLGLVTRCMADPMEEATKVAKLIAERSPDAVASAKYMFQETWVAPEEYCLKVETELQRKLLLSWNQLAASGRSLGWKLPYFQRKDDTL